MSTNDRNPAFRALRRGSVALTCAIVGGAVLASAAFAGTLAQNRQPVTSTPGSQPTQSATSFCPAGASPLLARTADITGGGPDVALHAVRFTTDTNGVPNGVQVEGAETDPVGANWSVTAFAVCGGTFTYVSQTSTPSSATTQSIDATCPNGTGVVGGGADIIGGGTDVALKASVPIGPTNPNSRRATATETNPVEANWLVKATAVCPPATLIFPAPATGPFGSNIFQGAGSACQGNLQSVLSGGGQANSADQVVALRSMKESGGLWQTLAEETDPTASGWSVTSQALCMQHWP
jgi:hypothetical protein